MMATSKKLHPNVIRFAARRWSRRDFVIAAAYVQLRESESAQKAHEAGVAALNTYRELLAEEESLEELENFRDQVAEQLATEPRKDD